MALKTFNPTSAGRRHLIQVDRSHLWKGKPVKALVEGQTNNGGRGNTGRITSRAQGRRPQAGLSPDRLPPHQA